MVWVNPNEPFPEESPRSALSDRSYAHITHVEDEDEEEDEDEDAEYEPGEWCENNVEAIEEALDTKLGELFTYDTDFVSPATIKEWESLGRGYKVLGSFHIEMQNWE